MPELTEQQKKELRQIVSQLLPDSVLVLGNMEHQLDLVSGIVKDLSIAIQEIAPDKLPPNFADKIEALDKFLTQSSLDFNQLKHFLYAELINGAINMKEYIRVVQARYFKEQGIPVPPRQL
jgi:hypothetical protein